MAKAEADRQGISGLVIPVEWDSEGKVVAVAIAAFDETTYRVTPGGKGGELFSRLQSEVTAWGRVENHPAGKTIWIERYQMSKSKKGKFLGLALATMVGAALTVAPIAMADEAKPAAAQPAVAQPAAAAPAAAAPAKAAPVKKGKKGKVAAVKPNPKVRALQDALNAKGAKLKVDGVMGKQTRMALKAFQKDNGLKVTGKVDAATKKALGF